MGVRPGHWRTLTRFTRKNIDENIEMDGGNTEEKIRTEEIMSKSRYDKHIFFFFRIFPFKGSPQQIFHFQLFLYCILLHQSTSINLLLGLPRFLFPGNSILSILLPIYPSYFLTYQWRIQGGFLVARKPPPPTMIFFNQRGDTVTGTDPDRPLTFATFGNPLQTNSGYATAYGLTYHLSLASHVFSPNRPTCGVLLMYSFLILPILVTCYSTLETSHLHLLSFRQCHRLQPVQHGWSLCNLVHLPFHKHIVRTLEKLDCDGNSERNTGEALYTKRYEVLSTISENL